MKLQVYKQSGMAESLSLKTKKKRAISHVLTFGTGDVPREDRLQFDKPSKNILTKLIDLEGIAEDARGHLFAITSHSRSIKGHLKQSRQQFVRFEIQKNLITDFEQFHFLGNCIRRKIGVNEINIEAISFDKNGKKLLIGLREPVLEGKSLIVVLANPNAIFEQREKPKILDQIFRLDLDGGGIRAMYFDQKLGGFLIANEIKSAQGKLRSAFWFWNGTAVQSPYRISIKGMDNIKNIEGITLVNIDGAPCILIVSDDGKARKHKGAHYAILRYDQFVIGGYNG